MGVDAEIYVKGSFTTEEITEADKFFRDRLDPGMFWHPDISPGPCLEVDDYDMDGVPRLAFHGGSRYYGPGYERGYWPDIFAAIRLMQRAFPLHQVHYGPDTVDSCEPASEERLEDLWQHWLGPDARAYYARA